MVQGEMYVFGGWGRGYGAGIGVWGGGRVIG